VVLLHTAVQTLIAMFQDIQHTAANQDIAITQVLHVVLIPRVLLIVIAISLGIRLTAVYPDLAIIHHQFVALIHPRAVRILIVKYQDIHTVVIQVSAIIPMFVHGLPLVNLFKQLG
jgi:hypothetical protein